MRLQEVRVQIELSIFEEIAPQGYSFRLYIVCLHLQLTIAQEISEKIRLCELSHVLKVSIVELEVCWVLVEQLTDTI